MVTPYNSTFICILAAIVTSLMIMSNQATNALAGELQNDLSPSAVPHLKDASLKLEKVLGGLNSPTNIAFLDNNDLLILEKNGTVQRAVNGNVSDKPLLNVNVSNGFFQGMLGIAIAQSNLTNNSTFSENELSPSVFLFYTEDKGNGTNPIGNRLYRYDLDLVNNRLINPKLLLDLPVIRDSWGNGGAITIGPDNYIYVTMGSVGNDNYTPQTLTLNYRNSTIVDGRSGILRITQDGRPVGPGILGGTYPLNLYYAYGMENSYGIDFDPVTNNLWDVENDGSFNDEVNIVKPGFNSGYGMITGLSVEAPAAPSAVVNFSGKGIYKDPEFVWVKKPVAVGLKFLTSDKLGKQYQNDLFVGGFQDGRIYNFSLTADRTHLALPQSLSKRSIASGDLPIADPIIFGEGFGGITNLVVSPDGYLYVVSFGTGEIYRIVKSTTSSDAGSSTIITDASNVTTMDQKNATAISIEQDASDLGDRAFSPSDINIKVGDTIKWTNNDPVIHTIVEGSPSLTSSASTIRPESSNAGMGFQSGLLKQGMTFKHSFDRPGTFNYYCSVHPTMVGKVIVVPSQ
jgi:aldose sugar dehydrogenase